VREEPIDALAAGVIGIAALYDEIGREIEMATAAPEMLSPHFSRASFEHSATAIEHRIANVMGTDELACAKLLCLHILEPVRVMRGVPIYLTSGFRCLEVNRLVGSSDHGQHPLGQASDIHDGGSRYDLAKAIAESTLDFDQLILEGYHQGQPLSGWVHVSHNPAGRNRRQVLTIPSGHGQHGIPGLHP
jgi:zinc D-Ala-D-Ala carboxypeptidase